MDDTGADTKDVPDDDRTPAWYKTRVPLALGVGLLLSWRDLQAWAGFLGCVVGLVWRTRILRGPHDEPPPWRYRKH